MGQGTFFDERLSDPVQYPVAAKDGFGNKRASKDMASDKLAALHFYQLAIPSPKAPDTAYNKEAALRGEVLFNGKAKCSTCHVPPLFTEPGNNVHKPSDIGI